MMYDADVGDENRVAGPRLVTSYRIVVWENLQTGDSGSKRGLSGIY
jgi:hypothetical protein